MTRVDHSAVWGRGGGRKRKRFTLVRVDIRIGSKTFGKKCYASSSFCVTVRLSQLQFSSTCGDRLKHFPYRQPTSQYIPPHGTRYMSCHAVMTAFKVRFILETTDGGGSETGVCVTRNSSPKSVDRPSFWGGQLAGSGFDILEVDLDCGTRAAGSSPLYIMTLQHLH